MSKIPLISWSWKEGRVWDNWMIVHFLSGAVIACALELLSLERLHAYLIALALLVAWEIGEKIGRIREETENLALDVVSGMLGFLLLEDLILPDMDPQSVVWAFSITLGFSIIGGFLGWVAYKKRIGRTTAF